MLCHIFSSGKHTDSKGNTKEWTNDDLDKICYQFKNVHSTVPICVGHPQTNSPAYGWLKDVRRIGGNLYCSFKDVQTEFKEALKRGLFKNRSISLDKDLNIRHLAFLGGQAPAIKGLEQFCFQDLDFEDCEIYEVSDFCDAETKVDDTEQIQQELLSEQKNEQESEDEENVMGNNKEVNVEESKKLQEELDAKSLENSKLKEEIESLKNSQKLKEFEDFTNSAIEKGNILPKHKESIINILSACDKAEKFNFSDNTEKSGVDVAKEFISSLSTSSFEDIANKDDAESIKEFSDPKSISIELEKIMKEQNVDLTTAFSKLNNNLRKDK